jgi:glucose/arabinose dehydrogenase
MQLREVARIFAQNDDPGGGHHFGSRLVFGRDGMLFATFGDRNWQRERSRRLDSHLGKIVRIAPDGSVPRDNPFVGRRGALDEIWSYGHRNVQGAALHPDSGVLWAHEHGPRGGDELNIVRAGVDYGWPDVTYGRDYVTRLPFGEATERDGVASPVHHWVPTSIAPSGMAFYTGDAFPEWKGDLFIGALREQKLVRLELDGERVVAEHALLEDMGSRIRDVRTGPDGFLYLLDESRGRILRLEPGER